MNWKELMDRLRPEAGAYLASMSSPSTVEGIFNELRKQHEEWELAGGSAAEGAAIIETTVVIEEAMKMVPADSENGVASLIFRLHQSRRTAARRTDISDVLKKLIVGSLLRSIPIKEADNVEGRPPIILGRLDTEPPAGYMSLEGEDAVAYIRHLMTGEKLDEKLVAKLDKMADEAREREESDA